MHFSSFVDQLREKKVHSLANSVWSSYWKHSWVAFADLIGFAYRCGLAEKQVAAQNIVVFQRAVERCPSRNRVRIRQFTDSVYAVAEDVSAVLQFACELQHACLALNLLTLETKARAQFRYLVVPRITIAQGLILQIPEGVAGEREHFGVNPATLIAGQGVVSAYYLEKRSAGSLISIARSDMHELSTVRLVRPDHRGSWQVPRNVLNDWRGENSAFLLHDGVKDLPWLLLASNQSGSGLRTDTIPSIKEKLGAFLRVWDAGFKEYTQEATSVDSIKHYGAAQRHVVHLVQALRGLTKRMHWTPPRLEKEIGTLK